MCGNKDVENQTNTTGECKKCGAIFFIPEKQKIKQTKQK